VWGVGKEEVVTWGGGEERGVGGGERGGGGCGDGGGGKGD